MIVVTGASGFIGSHLGRLLAERGLAFRPVVRRPVPGAAVVGAIDGATDWTEALRDATAVVHLAAHVHIRGGRSAIDTFRRVNAEATLNLARQAARASVRRFVFVSSIAVNGNRTSPGHPFTEDSKPSPHDDYGWSKYEAELGLAEIADSTGLSVTVIRPPLVYGPGVAANFRTLMRCVHSGLPLPLASVDNLRSLVSVANLCDFILLCASQPAAGGQTFLIADGDDISTPDLLRRVGVAMGRPARLFPFPPKMLRASAVAIGRRSLANSLLSSLQIDISKARSLLGWTPPQRLDEAIAETALHYCRSGTAERA